MWEVWGRWGMGVRVNAEGRGKSFFDMGRAEARLRENKAKG
jgi:hypothetical protein